jgi:Fe-S cluster biogenesis protein NfuA
MSTTQLNKAQKIQAIELVLDEIRPHLAVDGGNLEVVDITEEANLQIKWLGNCEGCTMSMFTLRAGVEQVIKAKFPEINQVVAING